MPESNGNFQLSGLSGKAYQIIQKEILEGRLAPGTVVCEALLAAQIGISRTPVGKAIRRLGYEGLVEQVPRYGSVVRSIGRVDLIDLFEVREALESFAAAKAALNISDVQLAKLELLVDAMRDVCEEIKRAGIDNVEQKRLKNFLAVDMAFHLLIIEASGNKRIQRIIRETKTLAESVIISWGQHDLGISFEETYKDHAKIYHALKQHSSEETQDLILEHIRVTKNFYLNKFDRMSNPLNTDLPEGMPADLVEKLKKAEYNGN
ncbi:MAG: FCD domain-containing protein [Opitutae bacterium]|nr:FCD domain-containing protein [Opitutae bacterium]